ncbi:MAG: hypothetical protein JSV96_03375 [Candidatus Aminicenantes bacterium]|nr:MAG: hypothetical protein JSV96_03375 [Candidatus Aminicenantes bacterium]
MKSAKRLNNICFQGEAIDHYKKFSTLLKVADSAIAEVDDAEKRLDGLKANNS